jgi:hypothetical protein
MTFDPDTLLVAIATIIGAAIGGIFTIFAVRLSQANAKITMLKSEPAPLITMKEGLVEKAKERIEIRISGTPADSAYIAEYFVKNTSSKTIESINFCLSIEYKGKNDDIKFYSQTFIQGNYGDGFKATPGDNGKSVVISCDYLNPGDEFSINIISPEDSYDFDLSFRKAGVRKSERRRVSASVINELLSEGGLPSMLLNISLRLMRP